MRGFTPYAIFVIVAATLCPAHRESAAGGAPGNTPPPDTRPAEELFGKGVSPGLRVVVVRDSFPISRLGSLATTMASQKATVANLRVELRATGEPPAVVGIATESDFPADFRAGFNVIDAFIGREEIVIAATVSDQICLWRIVLDMHRHQPDGITWVNSPVPYQAVTPFTQGTLSLVMNPHEQDPQDETWRLTVIDKRPAKPWTIRFEQSPHVWRFRAVEVIEGKTKPSSK